jgi:DNA-binding LacI/PurR family transcriptional regulator
MVARVSIRDVAREAGVSVTTVSHALNGKGRLNPETRERVREVADRLGYRPNPAARSLVSGRTGLIAAIPSLPPGLDVGYSDFAFFSELIAAATGVAVGRDNALGVSPPAADWFVWDRVPLDGVIVIEPVTGEPALQDLRRRGLPFVTVSADPAGGQHDAVVRSDDLGGVTRLLDHLVDAGADAVAMLAPPPINGFARDCVEAYRRWTASAGRPSLLDVIGEEDLLADPDAAYAAGLGRIVARRPRPDALFVPIELAAMSILDLVKERGIAVPGDLMLATTRDAGRVTTTDPPVTTLEWDYPEIGRRAAQMLLDLIEGARSAPCEEVIETTVVPRASTDR